MKYIVLIILSIFLLLGCSKKDRRIKDILHEAGDNRVEIETVLSFYSKDQPDSIKQIAAEYLIKNMQHHYAFDTV